VSWSNLKVRPPRLSLADTPLGIVGQVLPPAEAEVLLAAAS
jgi:hypothetical protein